jgi:rhodanese-related sulfurtransferase
VSRGDYDEAELESGRRWQRHRQGSSARRWLKIVALVLVIPLLLGAGVAFLAGRPLAFAVIHRLTARKFPDLRWIDTDELARWREDPSRPQPVVLDARTADEYAVSHLKSSARIDPYRPLLRPLRGFPKDTPIVVYSSVGYRAARVSHWLAGMGYSQVNTLDGSLFRWANEGRPVFRNDRPTLEVHPYDSRWGILLESRYRVEAPDVGKQSAAP